MAQKSMEDFFQPRKRRRPFTSKEGFSKILPDGQQTTIRSAKRQKQDTSGSDEYTVVGTKQQRSFQEKNQLFSVRHGQDGLTKLKGNPRSVTNADPVSGPSEGLSRKPCESANPQTSAKKGLVQSFTRPQTSAKKDAIVGNFSTQKSIQRRLFDDDEGNEKASSSKTRSPSKPSEAAPTPRPLEGMSPQKMKDSLKNCSKISELREKLARFNNASEKLKSFQAQSPSPKDQIVAPKPTLEFEITSPVKTPKKLALSPSPRKTPAYRRFEYLLRDVPPTLTLPYKYRVLKEAFHCLDTVSSFLHNRKEIITFKKLKTSVQKMLNRNFNETQLAQIKTVFPFAYIFRRERDLPNHKVTPNNKNKWQLTLQVNTSYAADIKAAAVAGGAAEPTSHGEYRPLTPAMLLEREKIFHSSLLELVLQHHEEFLAALDTPVAVESARVSRWHPEFPLESVPEVPQAALPAVPLDESGGAARDVLERARSLFTKYPHLQNCLEAVAGSAPEAKPAAEPEKAPGREPEQAPGPSSAAAPAPRGLPAGLLERIRAREAARQSRLMTRSPAETRRLEMLQRLPQLARSLRAIFVTERRAALPLDAAVARLADSGRSWADCDHLAGHVQLLAAEAPGFAQMMTLKAGVFVKISREVDVNAVVKALEKKLQQA